MQISDDTYAVVNYLDKFTHGNLRKKNDVEVVLEVCATYKDGAIMLGKILLVSKILWNVSVKLRNARSSAQEGTSLLEREIERSSDEFTFYLRDISKQTDKETLDRFEKIYFQETIGSTKNLIDLAHDFAKFKDFQQTYRQKA